MKKILYIFLSYFVASNAFANQPKDWQLGFQEAASSTMRDIVNFHDKLLLPIIIAINVHKTSTATLWVVLDGFGFLEALNLIQAYTIKNNTKTLIAIMIGNNNLS